MLKFSNISLCPTSYYNQPVEIVERKGIGHPDTMCDALAEELSRTLCRYYLDNFGLVLHHNVDKALLRGGSAEHSVLSLTLCKCVLSKLKPKLPSPDRQREASPWG